MITSDGLSRGCVITDAIHHKNKSRAYLHLPVSYKVVSIIEKLVDATRSKPGRKVVERRVKVEGDDPAECENLGICL